jgi:hypothetical protein
MPDSSEMPGASLAWDCSPRAGAHVHLDVTPLAAVMLLIAAVLFALVKVDPPRK